MKNTKLLLASLATAYAGNIIFNPGIAYTQPSFATLNPSQQQAGTYNVDPMHTSIGFEINHMGLSNIQGRFDKKSGTVNLENDITKSSVDVTIESASIDTNVEPRDKHLKTADFFEVEKYPTLTFKSTKISKKGNGYVAEGDLTIKDVTKKVSIPFRTYGPLKDPQGATRIGVIADPIRINRQDFHVAYDQKLPNGSPAVGNDVTIRVSLEATLQK